MDKVKAGAKLKELRLKAGETQQDVADAVGVTRQSICCYEAGEKVPSDGVKVKLAEHFHRTVGFLFF